MTDIMRRFAMFQWWDVLNAPAGKSAPRPAGYLAADDSWVSPHLEAGRPLVVGRPDLAGTLQ